MRPSSSYFLNTVKTAKVVSPDSPILYKSRWEFTKIVRNGG